MALPPTRFSWRVPLYAALAALVPIALVDLCKPDLSLLLNLFAVAPALIVLSLVLLIYGAIRRNRRALSLLIALAAVWAISVPLFLYGEAFRTSTRWLAWSHRYEREIMSQPAPANGDLKHAEWDGWGFAGADTTVYLVFDPADALSTAAKTRQAGKFNGIPCKVPFVHRLETHWYTVLFYTDQTWGQCSQSE
jgi:hypothetical protein